MPEVLALVAIACVMVAVAMMVQLDRVADRSRRPAFVLPSRSGRLRTARRAVPEMNPALVLLLVVFALLVLAGIAP